MLYVLLVLCLLLNAVTLAVVIAVANGVTRLVEQGMVGEIQRVTHPPVVSDQPVPRQPNYGDMVISQTLSDDIKLTRDI